MWIPNGGLGSEFFFPAEVFGITEVGIIGGRRWRGLTTASGVGGHDRGAGGEGRRDLVEQVRDAVLAWFV